MSFRKRNVAVSSNSTVLGEKAAPASSKSQLVGVRPSAVDGRLVTSTGNTTLDGLLAGHGGLTLGSSLLLEESGTTDYTGVLLRLYAAEGLVQGHHVHVIGLPEQWGRELPGLAGDADKSRSPAQVSEKMKIAWRYERLGQFDGSSNPRDQSSETTYSQPKNSSESIPHAFCHTFDLAKRLIHPPASQLNFLMLDRNPSKSPFESVIGGLNSSISSSPPNSVHRIIVPSLLSPAIYPPTGDLPQHFLSFQHGLRGLLAQHQERLTVMQSLPLSLYPRSCGLTRWTELLSNGVFELAPFPHSADADFTPSRDADTKEEPPQGLLRLHRLPAFHERGVGVPPTEVDWTFSLSRRRFTIKPFNLPPIEGDKEAQQNSSSEHQAKADMEF